MFLRAILVLSLMGAAQTAISGDSFSPVMTADFEPQTEACCGPMRPPQAVETEACCGPMRPPAATETAEACCGPMRPPSLVNG